MLNVRHNIRYCCTPYLCQNVQDDPSAEVCLTAGQSVCAILGEGFWPAVELCSMEVTMMISILSAPARHEL